MGKNVQSDDVEYFVSIGDKFRNSKDFVSAILWYRKAYELGNLESGHRVGEMLAEAGKRDESDRWFHSLALKGDSFAMNWIATSYKESGDNVAAEKWYRLAAESGFTAAMNSLGFALIKSGRVGEGKEWYERSANAGDHFAEFLLGTIYQKRSENELAEEWFRKSAKAGNTWAMRYLGEMLKERGQYLNAQDLFLESAQLGDQRASHHLAVNAEEMGDLRLAEFYYREACLGSDSIAMAKYGLMLEKVGRFDEALELFQNSADLGNSEGKYLLGRALNSRNRRSEAKSLLTEASEEGEVGAMGLLGTILQDEGDSVASRHWLEKGAKMGSRSAFGPFGIRLAQEENPNEAAVWFEKAIEIGQDDYLFQLGYSLQDQGEVARAREVFDIAKKKGLPGAESSIVQLEEMAYAEPRVSQLKFETFNMPMVLNRTSSKKWRRNELELSLQYLDFDARIDGLNLDEIKSVLKERCQLFDLPVVDIGSLLASQDDDNKLDKYFHSQIEKLYLLDFEYSEMDVARIIRLTTRQWTVNKISFETSIFVFAEAATWMIKVGILEMGHVGDREGAVAAKFLQGAQDIRVLESFFNPYEAKWDGILPIEHDPLTRVRFHSGLVMKSLRLELL